MSEGFYLLKSEIHQTLTGDATVLNNLKLQISGSGFHAGINDSESGHLALDHLWREYNKKCYDFDETGSLIQPHDAGYRPTGVGILPPAP